MSEDILEEAKQYEQKYLIGSHDGSENYVIPKTWWWKLIQEVERLREEIVEAKEHVASADEMAGRTIRSQMDEIESLRAENQDLKFANKAFVDKAMETWQPTVQERQVTINMLRVELGKLKAENQKLVKQNDALLERVQHLLGDPLRVKISDLEIENQKLKERADAVKMKAIILDALAFYANPETYFAIGFFPDSPNGPFMDDFSETEFGEKPGKKAREALGNES